MSGLIIRVASLPLGATWNVPGSTASRSGGVQSHVIWRFGQSAGALADAIAASSIMAAGSNISVLQFHDEATASPDTCLQRIHHADGPGLARLVRLFKPSGVAINFGVGASLAALLSQNTTEAAWASYLRGLASRVNHGTISITRAGHASRVVAIRCPVAPF